MTVTEQLKLLGIYVTTQRNTPSPQRPAIIPIPLVDAQFVPEVTHTAPGFHLGMHMDGQVHDQPAAAVKITRPNGHALFSAESRLPGTRGRVTVVSKGAPGAQHSIRQQPLWWRQGEVCHRGGVKDKRELGTVTDMLVTVG